jgi:hypothetical protein
MLRALLLLKFHIVKHFPAYLILNTAWFCRSHVRLPIYSDASPVTEYTAPFPDRGQYTRHPRIG